MNNFRLTFKLVAAVSFLALVIVIIAAIGYVGIVREEQEFADAYHGDVLALRDLEHVHTACGIAMATEIQRVLEGTQPWPAARHQIATARGDAEAAWHAYRATKGDAEEDALAAQADAAFATVGQDLDAVDRALQAQDHDALQTLYRNALRRDTAGYFAKLDQLEELQSRAVATRVRKNESDEGSLKRELLAATGIALVLAIGLAILLARVSRDLGGLVREVQTAGGQVGTSVTEIAATAKEQQATANEIAASTSEIGATAKEISATSNELVKTMGEVAAAAEQSAALAGEGHASLTRMEDTMRHVMDASAAINGKLGVLNEKAGNINQVVTTITKVADQTNLLSLNAAIEAEKAGEYGRGFAVVATEIRRLADQTAVATYDIEQIVKEMLSAVSGSVMGMDKFSDEVRRGVDEVRNVSGRLSEIIEQVQGLTPRFETVNGGMRAQATGAQQISEALAQLSEAAQQTVESLRQSNAAISQLNETAGNLRAGVERIRT